MDILCTRCGEPYEVFYITDEMTPEERDDLYAGRGCPCCASKAEVTNRAPFASEVQAEMKTLLGDDIDGLAAMMEDFGLV